MRILLCVLLLPFAGLYAQSKVQNGIKDPVTYLLKKVLLRDRDTGSIVLIPLKTKDIKHFEPGKQVKFWTILEKYYPGASKDSLSKMVSDTHWLDQAFTLEKFSVYFPPIEENETPDLEFLYKKYHYVPVFSISHPVYSKDRTTCIIYVSGYQEGPFTVEIKRDTDGNWALRTMTVDWLI